MEKAVKITGKKVGKTLIVKIDRKTLSKQCTGEEYQKIKGMLSQYTEKPTKKLLKEIVAIMEPKTTEKKKTIVSKIKEKVVKAKQEKVRVASKEDALADLGKRIDAGDVSEEEMKTLMGKFKKVEEEAPKAETTPRPRSGEFYGHGGR